MLLYLPEARTFSAWLGPTELPTLASDPHCAHWTNSSEETATVTVRSLVNVNVTKNNRRCMMWKEGRFCCEMSSSLPSWALFVNNAKSHECAQICESSAKFCLGWTPIEPCVLRNYLMSRLMAFVSSMEQRDTKNLVVSADLKIEYGSVLMGRVGHSVSQRPSNFCSIILCTRMFPLSTTSGLARGYVSSASCSSSFHHDNTVSCNWEFRAALTKTNNRIRI